MTLQGTLCKCFEGNAQVQSALLVYISNRARHACVPCLSPHAYRSRRRQRPRLCISVRVFVTDRANPARHVPARPGDRGGSFGPQNVTQTDLSCQSGNSLQSAALVHMAATPRRGALSAPMSQPLPPQPFARPPARRGPPRPPPSPTVSATCCVCK